MYISSSLEIFSIVFGLLVVVVRFSLAIPPTSSKTNNETEQEKKMLAPLLAKLQISPASTETILREVYNDVSEAVDDKKLALDATGRNSLYKIHVSLGKIVNGLNDKEKEKEKEMGRGTRKSSVTPSVLAAEEEEEDVTVLAKTPEAVEEEEEDTVVAVGGKSSRDSLVEELLSDDDGGDVDMSGT